MGTTILAIPRMSTIIRLSVIFAILASTSSVSLSQMSRIPNCDSAFPVCGWDSLSSRITYPELCKRAGIEGACVFQLVLDTSGSIVSFRSLGTCHPYFVRLVDSVVRTTKWLPAQCDGKPRPSLFEIPVWFYFSNATDQEQIHPVAVPTRISVRYDWR